MFLSKMKKNYSFNNFMLGLNEIVDGFGDGRHIKYYELVEQSTVKAFIGFSTYLYDKYKNIEFDGYIFYELYLLFEIFSGRIDNGCQKFSGLSLEENKKFILFCKKVYETKSNQYDSFYEDDYSEEDFGDRYEEMSYRVDVEKNPAVTSVLDYFIQYGRKNNLTDFTKDNLLKIRRERFYELYSMDLKQLACSYTNFIYYKNTKCFDKSIMRPFRIDGSDERMKKNMLESIILQSYGILEKEYNRINSL